MKVDRVRVKYSKEEREGLIAEQRKSGMSVEAFARSRGIAPSTFFGWTSSGKSLMKKKGLSIKFKPLDTKPLFTGSKRDSDAVAEIICGSVTVRLYRDR